jgi:chemotaxis protein methyltransferase CheR
VPELVPVELPSGAPTLSRGDFERLAAFIEAECGIHLPPAKRTLLESRLGRRVLELGMCNFTEYCDLVLGGDGDELVQLLDRTTTNKTDFFREARHFELLVTSVLPALARGGAGERRPIRVWSAGCSTGEEPYTLAMVLAAEAERRPLRFEILGTDLSTRALRRAEAATYSEDQIQPVPVVLRRRWLLRSVDDPQVVRVRRELRDLVQLRRLNLLDRDYRLGARVDVIFCRNVFIYFDRATQEAVLRRFARCLAPGGFLFLGHSETASGLDVPFDALAPAFYRRRDGGPEGA